MNVLITGATGFIGRYAVRRLIAEGVNLTLLSRGGGTVDDLPVAAIDLTDAEQVMNWGAGKSPDAIVHLAADIPAQFDGDPARQSFTTNTAAMLNILELTRRKNCYLVYASSMSVYGDVEMPISEETLPAPQNFYSSSKYVGDVLCEQFYQNDGLNYTSLRISAPYGSGSTARTVINIFLQLAAENKPLTLYGSGAREQDFIHAADVADAIWLALMGRPVGVLNIASGEAVSMKRLAQTIIAVSGSASEIAFSGKSDPQEDYRPVIAINRAGELLGWSPKISLESGLQEMIEQGR